MRDENTTSLAEIVTAAIITMMTAKQRQCEVMKACVCVCVVIAAFCMGSSRVPSQEIGWQRSVLYCRIQGTWQWQRIWLRLPGKRFVTLKLL